MILVVIRYDEPLDLDDAALDERVAGLPTSRAVVAAVNEDVAVAASGDERAGAVLNPSTPAISLEDIAGDLDFVLVMSVNPGFGGQAFIPHSVEKVRHVRSVLDAAGSSVPIEIDGGIDEETAPRVVAAGARILVAGQAIFGTADPERATRALRAAVTGAPTPHRP